MVRSTTHLIIAIIARSLVKLRLRLLSYCGASEYELNMTDHTELKPGPLHPGEYIKANLPKKVSVTSAAKVLGVGRPALSKLLNGKAALSQSMASRMEEAFGLSKEKLLQIQADYDNGINSAQTQSIPLGSYGPRFLQFRARDIEGWANRSIPARSLLPVLLRKLAHSTGRELTLVDFPGYDDAETKGWDGKVDAGSATPWIPSGMSRWEFGCNEDPKKKADADYKARTASIPDQDRKATTLIFVTPRAWPGKRDWIRGKEASGKWKAVRAYDSSDLEQWLEQSVQGQSWFAEQVGFPKDGFRSLDDQWRRWASVTNPELPKSLFRPGTTNHKSKLKHWLCGGRTSPLIIAAGSTAEGLAFLCCLFDESEIAAGGHGDRAIVVETREALQKLLVISQSFIAVMANDEVEREFGELGSPIPAILIRPLNNNVEVKPDITLELPSDQAFREALAGLTLGPAIDLASLARESGGSPTVLRRRLAKLEAHRRPIWGRDVNQARALVPMLLVGAWHAQSVADRDILALLGNCKYEDIEDRIARLLMLDDSPVWSVGSYRGVASKIDALFATHHAVTPGELDLFFFVADWVLSEKDPALELPEDERPMAGWYGKRRDHSDVLREGICETLVLLAVHGCGWFREPPGTDVASRVDALIKNILTPLTLETLLSQTGLLPHYAEASPNVFLTIVEDDLRSICPQIFGLLGPAGTGVFGSCPRTGLLWALETLAWKPEHLVRVSFILARLAERKIDDNWVNKPEYSLQSIFRCWMPQTAAPLAKRITALKAIATNYPAQAWKVCREQFAVESRFGHYNARPQWRNDASGKGEPVSYAETWPFVRSALDIALRWQKHDEDTLGDLVANMRNLTPADQETIWDLVNDWAEKEGDEAKREVLRERIRRQALSGPGKAFDSKLRNRAREAYELLTPSDVVVRHQWLFAASWVDPSHEELQTDLDFVVRDERIRNLRIEALNEIWTLRGHEGIQKLSLICDALREIGWYLAEATVPPAQRPTFIAKCLASTGAVALRNDEVVAGFFSRLAPSDRSATTLALLANLSDANVVRLLKNSPFGRDTWAYLKHIPTKTAASYWKEVNPGWMDKNSNVNEAVDYLLAANRPRAAFACARFALEELETSKLKRLLHDVATVELEQPGSFQLDIYYVSLALDTLQKRVGVTEEGMAKLEYLYIHLLDHTKHGVPNLERQLARSPVLYVQLLALVYKRNDGDKDPEAWLLHDSDKKEMAWSMASALLHRMKIIPGTDENGLINPRSLREWVTEVRTLCARHGRAVIGDHQIGTLMAALPNGKDGTWPAEAARQVLEEIGSQEIANGIRVGRYNSRGVHQRISGGTQERAFAAMYRNWSRRLTDYPYLSRTLEGIAAGYYREAAQEDSDEIVRRRLNR